MGQWQLQTLALLAACAHGPSQLAEQTTRCTHFATCSARSSTRRRRGRSRRRCSRSAARAHRIAAPPALPGDHPSSAAPRRRRRLDRSRLVEAPLKSLRAAHGTLHYELAAAVPFVLSLVDGGADAPAARRRRRRPRGHGNGRTCRSPCRKCCCSSARRLPPASCGSSPRRAAPQHAAPLAARRPRRRRRRRGASAPAAAMRSLLAASPESTEERASLLAAIQVAGDAGDAVGRSDLCGDRASGG